MSAAHSEGTRKSTRDPGALVDVPEALSLAGPEAVEVPETLTLARPGALERLRHRRGGDAASGRRARDRELAVRQSLADERRRIAADVHDLVMQDVSFALATARAIAGDPALADRYATAAVAAGERALAGARTIVSGLSARGLDSPVALLRESVMLAARETPLKLDILVPEESRADELTSFALVHIAREAVTNAVKHAAPSEIAVTLSRSDEWHLRVRDNGCGFAPAQARRGFGLESIRGHVDELGGRLLLTSGAGTGTTIEVFLP